MKKLTDEEKNWLLCYCMKPENIEIALVIGQLRIELRKRILLSFAKKLNEIIPTNLEEEKLWIPEVSDPPEKTWKGEGEYILYQITMDRRIQICLVCTFGEFCEKGENYNLWVGAPSKYKDCRDKELLDCRFKTKDVKLERDKKYPDWHWWFYPMGYSNIGLGDLSTLHCDDKKIKVFSNKLILSAKVISEELKK